MANTRLAGRITGNPMFGLCERVCIETKKVFDGCVGRYANLTYTVPLTGFTTSAPPFTFISATSSGESRVTDLVITPLENGKSRVAMNVVVPITVNFADATRADGSATGEITLARDLVLTVPGESVVSYEVEVSTGLVSTIGSFADDGTVTFTGCIVQVVKVVAPVELVLPSYGYCEYPPCEEYTARACNGALELPLFPPAPTDN